jgi:hypothetical protein
MTADTTSTSGEFIARIVAVKGNASLDPANAAARPGAVGDLIYLGDAVRTADDGAVVIAVVDGNTISFGHNQSVVFDDEFVGYCRLNALESEIGDPLKFDSLGQAVRVVAFQTDINGSPVASQVNALSSSIQPIFGQSRTERAPFQLQLVFDEYLTREFRYPEINLSVDRRRQVPDEEPQSPPVVSPRVIASPVVSILEDANNDGFINIAELAGNVDVRINLPAGTLAGDTLTVKDGTTTNTFVITTADLLAGFITTDFAPPADGSQIKVTATIADATGSISPEGSDQAVRDTTAPSRPTVTITEDKNNDGILSKKELEGNVDVKVTLPPDARAGDKLTVTDGTTTTTITLTTSQIAQGNVSVSFPPPAEGGTITVTATLTDPAGNTSPSGTDSALRDTVATAAPGVSITEDTNNDGKLSASELIGNVDVTLTIPATAVAGDTLTVTDGSTVQSFVLTAGQIVAGTVTTSFTPPADGSTITVTATVTDVAGNTSAPGSDSALRDTTAPGAPVVTISEDTNNDGRISSTELVGNADVIITLPANAVVGDVLTVTDGITTTNITLTATQVAAGNIQTTFAPPADGSTITVTATITDTAGNTSATGTDAATRDTTRPAAPTVVITEDANNDGQITAAELVGNVDVRITLPAGAVAGDTLTVSAGGSTQTIVLTPAQVTATFVDVNFTPPALGVLLSVSATLTDLAGNVSPAGTDHALRPTGGLPVPGVQILEDANNDGRLSNAELSGNVDVRVSIPAGAVVGDVINITDGAIIKTVTLTAGQITAGFVLTDFVPPGNGITLTVTATWTQTLTATTSAPGSDSVLRDATAPSTPTVVITEDANNDGRISAAELSGNVDVTVTLPGDAVAGDVLNVSDGRTTHTITLSTTDIGSGFVAVVFTPPAQGATVSVTANITDAAGNTSGTASDSAVRDTSATPAPGVMITEDTNNDGRISLSELSGVVDVLVSIPVGAVAGDTLTVTDGAITRTFVLTGPQITAGSIATDFAAPANGATITVTATLTDQAGNASPTATDSAVRDTSATAAPVVVITTDANNDGLLSPAELTANVDVTITLPGTAVAGDVLSVSDGITTQLITLTTANIGAGNVSTTFTSPPAGSTITVTARVTDAAGNVSPPGTDAALRSSSAPAGPTVTITEDANNDGRISSSELSGNVDATINLPGTAVAGNTLTVSDGITTQTITLTAAQIVAGVVAVNFAPPAEGSQITVTATITNAGGVVSVAEQTVPFAIRPRRPRRPSPSLKTRITMVVFQRPSCPDWRMCVLHFRLTL